MVAFLVVPGWAAGTSFDAGALVGDSLSAGALADPFRAEFAAWWHSGAGELSPDLARIVDFWFRYHLAKAVLAALLLVVLIALAVRLRRWWALAPVTALGLLALAALMANLQGAVAPFASLFPLLSVDDLRAPAEALRTGNRPPALATILDNYVLYHAAMIAIAGTVAVASLAAAIVLGRRFRRSRVHTSFAVVAGLVAVVALVLTAANTTTTLNPEPGLAGLFSGGW